MFTRKKEENKTDLRLFTNYKLTLPPQGKVTNIIVYYFAKKK